MPDRFAPNVIAHSNAVDISPIGTAGVPRTPSSLLHLLVEANTVPQFTVSVPGGAEDSAGVGLAVRAAGTAEDPADIAASLVVRIDDLLTNINPSTSWSRDGVAGRWEAAETLVFRPPERMAPLASRSATTDGGRDHQVEPARRCVEARTPRPGDVCAQLVIAGAEDRRPEPSCASSSARASPSYVLALTTRPRAFCTVRCGRTLRPHTPRRHPWRSC